MKKTTKICTLGIFLLEIVLKIVSIRSHYATEVLFEPVNSMGLFVLDRFVILSLLPYLLFLLILKDLVQRSQKRGVDIAVGAALLVAANWNALVCWILPYLFPTGLISNGCAAIVLAMQAVWNWLLSSSSYTVVEIGYMTQPVVMLVSFLAAYFTAKAIGKDER